MQKIEALKLMIYNLENDVYRYEWAESDSCNCGILARTITGKDIWDLGYDEVNAIDYRIGPWTQKARCMISGMPMPEVFQKLMDAGFTSQDIIGLENLSNEALCNKLGWKRKLNNGVLEYEDRHIKSNVIQYLKAWVEILEEEQKPAEPQPKIQYIQKVVQVPSTLNEQVKQVIQTAEATS